MHTQRPLSTLIITGLLGFSAIAADAPSVTPAPQPAAKQAPAPAAQEPAAGPRYELTLEQAEDMALHYSYALQAARQEREVARGRIMSAWGEALPQVGAQLTKNLSDTRSDYDRDQWNDSYTAAVVAKQPLFKAGKMGAAFRGARYYSKYAEENIRLTHNEVLHATRVQYYAILFAQELVKVSKEQVELSSLNLDDLRKRFEQGVATRLDTLRGEVELTNEETQFINDQNDLTIARSNLLKLLGLPLQAELGLKDDMTFIQRSTESEETLYRLALGIRPDVKSSELAIMMQRENITSVRSGLFPQLDLEGQYLTSANAWDFTDGEWDQEWQVGLTLSWTIFDGLAVRGAVKEQRAELEKLILKDKDLADNVRLQIRQALLDLQYAHKSIERQAKNVEQATESLRLFVEREKQGVSTHLDVLTARQTLAESKRNYFNAVYTYNVAWTDLQLSMGTIEKGGAAAISTDKASFGPQPAPKDERKRRAAEPAKDGSKKSTSEAPRPSAEVDQALATAAQPATVAMPAVTANPQAEPVATPTAPEAASIATPAETTILPDATNEAPSAVPAAQVFGGAQG